jgi:hypothetical protein
MTMMPILAKNQVQVCLVYDKEKKKELSPFGARSTRSHSNPLELDTTARGGEAANHDMVTSRIGSMLVRLPPKMAMCYHGYLVGIPLRPPDTF